MVVDDVDVHLFERLVGSPHVHRLGHRVTDRSRAVLEVPAAVHRAGRVADRGQVHGVAELGEPAAQVVHHGLGAAVRRRWDRDPRAGNDSDPHRWLTFALPASCTALNLAYGGHDGPPDARAPIRARMGAGSARCPEIGHSNQFVLSDHGPPASGLGCDVRIMGNRNLVSGKDDVKI